jgi:hypothetical protein
MSDIGEISTDVKITPLELQVLSTKIIEAFPSGITVGSVTVAVIDCMTMVGQIDRISGSDKKQLVIDMLIYIVNHTDSGSYEVMDPIIVCAVPIMIEALIDVEKGKLRFNPKIAKKFKMCC